jgi:hypothetical protein
VILLDIIGLSLIVELCGLVFFCIYQFERALKRRGKACVWSIYPLDEVGIHESIIKNLCPISFVFLLTASSV